MPHGVQRKERRQQTVKPSSIPSYAAPCSGPVRYSSACSCLGVTAKTIYASTPVTTTTVSSTYTPTQVTVYTTVLTKSSTTTVTTTTDTTIDVTITATATATVNPMSPFYIQVATDISVNTFSVAGQYVGTQYQYTPRIPSYTSFPVPAQPRSFISTMLGTSALSQHPGTTSTWPTQMQIRGTHST